MRTRRFTAVLVSVLVASAGLAAMPAGVSANGGGGSLDPAGCSDGTYVEDPGSNRGLVADCAALVAIGNHFLGNPANAGLDYASPWKGTKTSSGRVVELNLSNNRLSGTIPAQIGDLGSLQSLDLSNNRLTGSIPA